jgi:zinc transport system substrate-binding protein
MKLESLLKLLASIAVVFGVALIGSSCGDRSSVGIDRDRLVVFVSIPPQKTFVQAIAKDNVDVHVMIRPGFSPATYDPTPKQLLELSRADLYLRIGVPFEDAWMHRIREASPAMMVVDTREGIDLMPMTAHSHEHDHDTEPGTTNPEPRTRNHEHRHPNNDPHVWLDPVLVKQQAVTIAKALKTIDPPRATAYDANLLHFLQELETLNHAIHDRISQSGVEKFMIFHPSLGYFARRYGLEQIPIEVEGKSPGASKLGEIIEHARDEGIHTVFVQKEFSSHAAEKIAEAIAGQVVVLDPLASDYFANMHQIADAIAAQNNRQ